MLWTNHPILARAEPRTEITIRLTARSSERDPDLDR